MTQPITKGSKIPIQILTFNILYSPFVHFNEERRSYVVLQGLGDRMGKREFLPFLSTGLFQGDMEEQSCHQTRVVEDLHTEIQSRH